MHSVTVTATGEVRVSDWPDDARHLLTHLYREIGCTLVTSIALGRHLTLWCDDEGLLVDRPRVNELATKLAGAYGDLRSYLVGTVVITGPHDADGKTQPLPAEAVEVLRRILEVVSPMPVPALHPNGWVG